MTEPVATLITQLRQKKKRRLLDVFAADGNRFADFSRRLDDLLLDFSKTSIERDDLQQLLTLAQEAKVTQQRDSMFAGEKINRSENRAALHTALRGTADTNLQTTVDKDRAAMLAFAEHCRNGNGDGAAADGKPYTDIITIGIGGSNLGPQLVATVLAPYRGTLRLHFVSNMDGAHLSDTLAGLKAERTLLIISSKTFTTLETMTNADRARRWLTDALGETAAAAQTAAVTAAAARATDAGIARVFSYQEWVGGRYSLWGTAGLPIALAIGADHFNDLLRGAAAMDTHFQNAPAADNLPLLFALVGIWHRNICGYPARVLLPYDERLRLLPAYIQQLDMESNGKSVRQDGAGVTLATAPLLLGSVGTDAQHAYFQLLHQGTDIVPCEFIAARRPTAANDEQHRLLLANCLAQSAALMRGNEADTEAARHCPGNRPSVTLLYDRLTPYALGRLLALYEHRTFCEGAIWGINSFDQWGVELGKTMATQLLPQLAEADTAAQTVTELDDSTQGLIAYCRKE